MLTRKIAHELAHHWIAAWNAHNLDQILSHYEEDIVLISPIAAKLLGDPSGTVRSKEALRAYFKKGLSAYPDLRFELKEVMWGVNSIVLHYLNAKGIEAAELMEIGPSGKVARVIAHYND